MSTYLEETGLAELVTKINSTFQKEVKSTINVYSVNGASVTITNGTETYTKTVASGVSTFTNVKQGGWIVTVLIGGVEKYREQVNAFGGMYEVHAFTQENTPVGGRIFYIHNDNGALYEFYDASGNNISTQTVAGLANAVTYSVLGTPSADKFYVYDNSGTSPTSGLKWATSQTTTGITADTIGSGKTNTRTAMQTASTQGSGTVFNWATSLTVGGCNDWYVGSKAEYDKLRASGFVSWFSNTYIWSSVESSSSYAYFWSYNYSSWLYDSKTGAYGGVALRSF